jgi:mono/diheme cytochrome c family protein
MKFLAILAATLMLSGCFNDDDTSKQVDNSQLGKATFEKNCLSCHGKEAQGLVKNWKQRDANGNFPAPPLNGSAHAWHHSPAALMNTINNGGIKIGGWMPAFKDQLSADEKQAVLDYIHDLWPDNIQQKYDSKFN